MSPASFFNRCVLVAAVVLGGAAFAQPANDLCENAEVLSPTTAGVPVLSTAADIINAAIPSEASFSCQSNTSRSVWFTITPSITGSYQFETCPTVATGTTAEDTVIAVYSGGCAAPVQLVGGCDDDACSLRSRVVVALTAGTQYWIQAAKYNTPAPGASVSRIQVAATYFSVHPYDVCSASTPSLTLERVTAATTGPFDAGFVAAADNSRLDGGVAACFAGINHTVTTAPGRDIAYMFRAPAAGSYTFRAETATPNTVLYLTNTCLPSPGVYGPAECVGAANRTTSAAEQISCVPMTSNQEVFVWVDEATQSTAGGVVPLEVSTCFPEVEPNNTPAEANPLICTITGSIRDAGEADFFDIGSPPAGARVYALVEAAATANTDFDLRVTTATSTLEYDDANAATQFGGSSGLVAGTPLPGGPAYLRVNYSSATTAAEPYVLYSKVQTGIPTPEIEPNDTFATATGGSTYYEGSIQDGGTDVDFFSFRATEGDIIFAALDAVPDRTDAGTTATFNFTLTLVDSTGATLLAVDDTSNTVTLTTNPDGGLTAVVPTVPAEAIVYRARTTGTYGLRVGKTSGTTVTAYGLSISVGCNDVAPTLSSFTPTAGSPAGNETVTLTGSNFGSQTVVRFGGRVARVVSVTPTEIVVATPSATQGGDVSVSVANGVNLVATAPGLYTYEDPAGLPPNVTAISPVGGPAAGGTVVTITGTVFRPNAAVYFSSGGTDVEATAVTVNSTTRITATTPAHAPGPVDVKVVNADTLSGSLPNGYTFLGPPTLSAITPAAGLTTGGQTITLTGTNLRAGTTVRIGGTLATSPTPASDGLSMTAITPSNASDVLVDVLVRTTDGQEATLTGAYKYNFPAPTLATVSPTSGFQAGNTLITLTGTNFLASPAVTVGGAAATSVTRVSATSITARTPAGTPGPQPVVVTNSDGQATSATVNFTYVAAPAITAVSPSNGSALGGTRITLTGDNFLPGARVSIGGNPAFAVAVGSSTTLTATTNSGTPGTFDVTVTNPDTQAATLDAAFTLDAAPDVVSLSPLSGSTAGGTVVTLTGTGFRQGAEVLFGSTPATSVTVSSPTELTATTAMHAIGVVSVTVRNPDGQSDELARSFRFVDPPTLTAVAPESGDVAGGNTVRLTGAGFTQSSTVTFDGVAASQVTLVSPTELDAVAPAHAPGAVDVVVSVEGATATLAGGYTYVRGAPTVRAAAPANGPIEGGTLVTVTGSGFVDGATVTFGGTEATGVVVVSADLLRAVAPAHAAGAVELVVTNTDAQSGSLSAGFTYVTASGGPDNSITDGGSGAVGEEPTHTPTPGGVSCGCTSFDGSMFGFAGLGLVALLSRRRRRG